MANWFESEFLNGLGAVVEDNGFLSSEASKLVIDAAVNTTRNRPHPWSTFADYPNWRGLTDRTYLARHLSASETDPATLPDIGKVMALFARPEGGGKKSDKSTCLFPAFAQYLTDGFIRSNPVDCARTTSNHEIDMCPLYGRTVEQTHALRLNSEAPAHKGRLKSQLIAVRTPNGSARDEEFPPFLYKKDGSLTDPAFIVLDPPLFAQSQPIKPPTQPAPPPPTTSVAGWEDPGRALSLFATGGDRVNSSPFTAMMNTIWLREHNRLAGELEARNPTWDDEHVFQVARNILIPMFVKIVVEDYINHIIPLPLKLKADPSVAWDANWNRPNWMTAEFSPLYRWHGLLPDSIAWTDGTVTPTTSFSLDNRKLLEIGVDATVISAASQCTMQLGPLNTTAALQPIEWASITQARKNKLRSYNEYRVAFDLKPATQFSDISSNAQVQTLLKKLYGTPDKVEFYPGMFAENKVDDSPLPELILKMVAVDAFSQALTNPLLSQHVWKDNPTLTFTDWGFNEITNTGTLADVLRRQNPQADLSKVTMTLPGWSYVKDPQ